MADTLGFLISDVGRLLRKRFDEHSRLGTTRAQWRVLLLLARNEGLNQGAIADRLEVEPITLCRMIDRLEDAGLVERRRDPADRRAWRIYLTDAAEPVLERMRGCAAKLSDLALDGLSEADREHLRFALERMRENLTTTPSLPETANG